MNTAISTDCGRRRPDNKTAPAGRYWVILIWLPVLLLPAGNIFLLAFHEPAAEPLQLLTYGAGAVAEEMIFRGLLLKRLMRTELSETSSIMIVAVLFSAMHLVNLHTGSGNLTAVLVQTVCAFGFSVWAGAAVWATGKITAPLLGHVLLNITSLTDGTVLPLVLSTVVLLDGILLIGMQRRVSGRGHSGQEDESTTEERKT